MIYLDGNFLHYSAFCIAYVYFAVSEPGRRNEPHDLKALSVASDLKAMFCCFLEGASTPLDAPLIILKSQIKSLAKKMKCGIQDPGSGELLTKMIAHGSAHNRIRGSWDPCCKGWGAARSRV